MSAQATSWAWSHAKTVDSQGQLLVLLALAEHASPQGVCYPSRKTIGRLCGFDSPGSVTRNINKLEEAGLLEKDARFVPAQDGETARQTSNIYRLKLEVEGIDPGGAVATGGVEQAQLVPAAPSPPQEPNNGEPTTEPTDMAEVTRVFEHWKKVFEPARPPKLGPSQIKVIRKGLAEYSADDLCLAIDGLFEWRKRKPGNNSLGAILTTYPGGKPLVEQIAFFISQSKGSSGSAANFPSADRAIVSEHQRWVVRGHRRADNAEAVQQAKESELWLFEHGIAVVHYDGLHAPTFRPRSDKDEVPA